MEGIVQALFPVGIIWAAVVDEIGSIEECPLLNMNELDVLFMKDKKHQDRIYSQRITETCIQV